MALRYFCAKLSKIVVSVCTYLWELNTQLILGIYQKNGSSNFITDRDISNQSVVLRHFYSEEVVNFGHL